MLTPAGTTTDQPVLQPGWRRSRGSRAAVVLLAAALSIALIRGLVVQSFVIPTGSMEPALVPGDRVLVSRFAYRFGTAQRGDVIVFDGAGVFDPMPASSGSALAGAGRTIAGAFGVPVGSQDYVKRVIGLPGERVTCCTPSGQLLIDGVPLDEPYLRPGEDPSAMTFDVVVPNDRLWVMGDHRSASADSRAHLGDPGGGTVPLDRVVGRVMGIFWPRSHVGTLGYASSGTTMPQPAEGTG